MENIKKVIKTGHSLAVTLPKKEYKEGEFVDISKIVKVKIHVTKSRRNNES